MAPRPLPTVVSSPAHAAVELRGPSNALEHFQKMVANASVWCGEYPWAVAIRFHFPVGKTPYKVCGHGDGALFPAFGEESEGGLRGDAGQVLSKTYVLPGRKLHLLFPEARSQEKLEEHRIRRRAGGKEFSQLFGGVGLGHALDVARPVAAPKDARYAVGFEHLGDDLDLRSNGPR